MWATGVRTMSKPARIRKFDSHIATGRLPQAQIQVRIQDLLLAQSDCGTGERSDQGMPGFAALSAAGIGEGERRVAPDCRHPQPAQIIQIPPITTAGAGCSNGMRGGSPGNEPRATAIPTSIWTKRQKNRAAVVRLSCDLLSAGSLSALLATNS